MKTQCAWCRAYGPDKPPYEDTSVSHGICEPCGRKLLRQIRRPDGRKVSRTELKNALRRVL